jgi:hypothetical protein
VPGKLFPLEIFGVVTLVYHLGHKRVKTSGFVLDQYPNTALETLCRVENLNKNPVCSSA